MSSAVWYCTQGENVWLQFLFSSNFFPAPSPCGPCGLAARFRWLLRLRPYQVQQNHKHDYLKHQFLDGKNVFLYIFNQNIWKNMVLSYSFPQVVGEVHQNHKWKSEWHFTIFLELDSLVNLLSYLVFRCASISWFQVVSHSVSHFFFTASASTGLSDLFKLNSWS